jgi:hypothetical protein
VGESKRLKAGVEVRQFQMKNVVENVTFIRKPV